MQRGQWPPARQVTAWQPKRWQRIAITLKSVFACVAYRYPPVPLLPKCFDACSFPYIKMMSIRSSSQTLCKGVFPRSYPLPLLWQGKIPRNRDYMGNSRLSIQLKVAGLDYITRGGNRSSKKDDLMPVKAAASKVEEKKPQEIYEIESVLYDRVLDLRPGRDLNPRPPP